MVHNTTGFLTRCSIRRHLDLYECAPTARGQGVVFFASQTGLKDRKKTADFALTRCKIPPFPFSIITFFQVFVFLVRQKAPCIFRTNAIFSADSIYPQLFRVSPHNFLRHNFSTTCQQYVRPDIVDVWMGDSSERVVGRVYTHFPDKFPRE